MGLKEGKERGLEREREEKGSLVRWPDGRVMRKRKKAGKEGRKGRRNGKEEGRAVNSDDLKERKK